MASRKVPLACAPVLVGIAEREPLLADLTAVWLSERPQDAAGFPADPGEVVDDVLAAEWRDDDGQPLHPVAYSVGGYHGPIVPRPDCRDDKLPAVLTKLGDHGEPVATAFGELPKIAHESDYDWSARQAEEHRQRDCFALTDEDADAARAFGCLLELPGPDGHREPPLRHRPRVAGGSARAEDRGARRGRGRAQAARARRRAGPPRRRTNPRRRPAVRSDSASTRRASSARARNLDLGAALAKWQPKLDTDAVKLLGSLVLLHHGKAAAWAHRLCTEQPTSTNKQGTVSVRYPRGAEAEKQLHGEALEALKRARTPEAALAVVLRLLVAQRLVDTAGLPNADRQGIYEPQELSGSKVLDKLARRVAPSSVKQPPRRAGGRAGAARAGPAGRAGGAVAGAAREARGGRAGSL